MCGIAGVFGRFAPGSIAKVLNRMLDRIEHRGPDGRGVEIFDHAALGHVRLAIIDLKGGRQPMSTEGKQLSTIYNGEIYNFRAIRKELEEEGVSFSTDSDTEVLLKGYQHSGMSIFNRFRGMFAFALWDSSANEGLLVRDRHGIKPLFYYRDADQLIFSSEVKGLLPALSSKPQLSLSALHALMNFRYIPGEQTMFDDVMHLPPGHYIKWRNGLFEKGSWVDDISACDFPHGPAAIRNSLKNAVHRQLVSDVPLGGYLSAGLDSSTILSLAQPEMNASGRQYPTFTIQTGDSPLEAKQAAETAAHYAVPNFQEPIHCNIAEILPRLIYHLEVPKVNALQSAMVARLAAKHVKVALSGLGGDEIFLGYTIHRMLAKLEPWCVQPARNIARFAGIVGQPLCEMLGMRFEEGRRASMLLKRLPDLIYGYGVLRNVWDSPAQRRTIYGPRMLQAGLDDMQAVLHRKWPRRDDPVEAAACFEFGEKMVNDLLLQEDRLSMAFGLEVRVPFLDEDLVAHIMSIDRRLRMKDGKMKYLMRSAVSEWLPEKVIKRPKSGFQVPVHIFFNTHLRPLCESLLCRKRLLDEGLFNPDFVESVLAAKPHMRLRWHYFMLYLMLGVNTWLDIFQNDQEVRPWN